MLKDAYNLSFFEFDEEKDIESYDVLLCDLLHGSPPMKPLYIGLGWYWYYHAIRFGAEMFHLPTAHGWDSRFINGYPYITTIRTTDEERKEREPIFREQIKPYLENFDGVWDPFKEDLIKRYKEARESRGLKEWGDIKKLSNIELLSFFLDFAYILNRREAEVHFTMQMVSYYISSLFQQMWKDIFGIEAAIDPKFGKVAAGFESMSVKVVRELWKLARRLVELNLTDALNAENNEEVLKNLEKSEVGRQWLKEYKEFLFEHGWRCERMHAYDTPAWVEKPALAIGNIRMLMSDEVFVFDAVKDKVIVEREETIKEIMEKVPAAQRDIFKILLKATQKAGYWSEDHTYFCDFYIGAMGRWIFTEYGRRFAEAGCIDDPEDIHFLRPDDIRKAAIPMGKVNLRHYVEPRKKAYLENLKIEPEPFYGNIDFAQDILRSDPTLSVSTQVPIVREDLKADLYGAASAPGLIEGVARVIMTQDKLPELQPNEILVAPGVSAAWTVSFGLIGGLITDGGGALSHPVIMAREFSIPCIAGCVEATAKIKTGMRVRVDGDQGVVYILG